jgi:diguanylate cyclase (GGDEF)-like protein
MLVAGAVGVSSGQSMLRVWWANYATMWRGHFLGVSIATMAAAGIAQSTLCLIPLAITILALTYGNFKTYAERFTESLTDPLTDLPNRRSLMSRAKQEIARAERERSQIVVMVVDLNRFKSINDTYGHAAGDAVLRHVAHRLGTALRAYDVCARYGGDEFIVLVPGCGTHDAEQKAHMLRQRIREAACVVKPGVNVPLRISVGTAVFPIDGRTFEDLFAVADGRMYQDKGLER